MYIVLGTIHQVYNQHFERVEAIIVRILDVELSNGTECQSVVFRERYSSNQFTILFDYDGNVVIP